MKSVVSLSKRNFLSCSNSEGRKYGMKSAIIMICLFAFGVIGCKVDSEKVIDIKQLPTLASSFVNAHFPDHKVAVVKMESGLLSKSYEVYFANGDHIDFDAKGVWEEVECKSSAVPSAVVPESIREYVAKTYPEEQIKKLEKDRWKYEVKLSNHIELTLDLKFNLKDVDM